MIPRLQKILILGTEASMLYKFHGPLIDALINANVEVHLASNNLEQDGIYAIKLRGLGAHLHSITIERNGMNPLQDLIFAIKLLGLLKKIKPTIFLAYTVKPVVYGMFSAALAQVPRRVALIVGLGYAFIGKATGKRAALKFITSLLYKFALRQTDHVCFQNADDQKQFINLKILSQTTVSSVVNGCGVDLEYFRKLPLPKTVPKFLMVGRLLGDKGLREYAQAARNVRQKFSDVEFLLLGSLDSNPDSITKVELESWTNDGTLIWLGFEEDVRETMSKCHVFVLPSYREGLPQSAVEALACGRPIITTDVPGCRETVIDGVNGYLVRSHSSSALETAILRFLRQPENLNNMATESRKLAETKFSSNIINAYLFTVLGVQKSVR